MLDKPTPIINRVIFGNAKLTDFEKQTLEKFKSKVLSVVGSKGLPKHYTEEELLRLLHISKFNLHKAKKVLQRSLNWRNQILNGGFCSLRTKVEHLLNSGSIYLHGRDCFLRPMLVVDFNKFDLRENTVFDYCNLLFYLLEYTLNHLLVSGEIEQVLVIVELAELVTQLPLDTLKVLLKILSENYSFRLGFLYIVNAQHSFACMWGSIKHSIKRATLNKIKIQKPICIQNLRSLAAPHQYEKRFGGNSQSPGKYWPPYMPQRSFHKSAEVFKENFESPNKTYSTRSNWSGLFPLEKSYNIPKIQLQSIENCSPQSSDSFVSMNLITSKSPCSKEAEVAIENKSVTSGFLCGGCSWNNKNTCFLI